MIVLSESLVLKPTSNSYSNPDCLIIGAGIFGLWAARHAVKRGESVLVVDKAKVGSGASGGFLGSLMPHEPVRWNEKKQMQFEALDCLSAYIEALEEDTGLDCGYRRCGRIIPLRHEKMDFHVNERIEGMKTLWQGRYMLGRYNRVDKDIIHNGISVGLPNGWVNTQFAAFGATYDNFSARVNPRAYLSALAAFVRDEAEILEGLEVVSIGTSGGTGGCEARLSDGGTIFAGRIIIANGYLAYGLLAGIDARYKTQIITGKGVKGQAVLVEYNHDDTLPIVYDDGVYIVPHAENLVAIGSTSKNVWLGEKEFDNEDMGFYERAIAAVPALKDAPILEKWAGVRPRNIIPEPLTGKILSASISGRLDEYENIYAAIGGFKIGMGIAHMDNTQP